MCRVLLMNKKGEEEIQKVYGLENYLKYLEKQLGGHGNGFALLKNSKVIRLEKGMNLDVRDIAKIISKTDYDWCLFHTRLASIGTKTDSNCHPFQKNDIVLAMNGTEHSVEFISQIKEITDTEAILDLISKYNLGLTALRKFSSIFMGFYKGKPFVVANNMVNIQILCNIKDKALVFASKFPESFKNNIFEPEEHFIWFNNKLPKMSKRRKKNYTSPIFLNDYIYHKDLYEQCYIEAYNNIEGGNDYGIHL